MVWAGTVAQDAASDVKCDIHGDLRLCNKKFLQDSLYGVKFVLENKSFCELSNLEKNLHRFECQAC